MAYYLPLESYYFVTKHQTLDEAYSATSKRINVERRDSFLCKNKDCSRTFPSLKAMVKHHKVCYTYTVPNNDPDGAKPDSEDIGHNTPPDSMEAGPSGTQEDVLTTNNIPTWLEDNAIVDFLTSIANGGVIDYDFNLLKSPPLCHS